MLHIEELLFNVKNNKIMSNLDLTNGHHQIPINEANVLRTAITVPSGSYTFKNMLLGVSGALTAF